MDPTRRAFYEYHAAMMEPWTDPPRSRLRTAPNRGDARQERPAPSRYIVTADDLVIMGSNAAACPCRRKKSSRSGACSPAGCSSSIWRRAGSSTTRSSRTRSRRETLRGLDRAHPRQARRGRDEKTRRSRARCACSIASRLRLHAGGHQIHHGPMAMNARTRRLDGQRLAACRAVGQEQDLYTTSNSCSRRSRTPDRPDPRGAGESLVSFIGRSRTCSASTR